jgi:hypothetical protein
MRTIVIDIDYLLVVPAVGVIDTDNLETGVAVPADH